MDPVPEIKPQISKYWTWAFSLHTGNSRPLKSIEKSEFSRQYSPLHIFKYIICLIKVHLIERADTRHHWEQKCWLPRPSVGVNCAPSLSLSLSLPSSHDTHAVRRGKGQEVTSQQSPDKTSRPKQYIKFTKLGCML